MNATALRATLAALLNLPREQAVVEFKSNLLDAERIGAYLSGLANTAALQGRDRAWLVWGVEDGSHQVQGTAFDPFRQKIGKGLRDMGLIEGRAPRYFISAKVADALGQKAKYIHQRGLDDKYYQRLVLDYLQQYGQATRADLDALLLRKLPDVLSAEQKANKIKNLMQGMKRAGLIQAHGPRSMAVWRLCTALDK